MLDPGYRANATTATHDAESDDWAPGVESAGTVVGANTAATLGTQVGCKQSIVTPQTA
jgi:hypothetical protein